MFAFFFRGLAGCLCCSVFAFSIGRADEAADASTPAPAAEQPTVPAVASLFPDPKLEAEVRARVFSKRNNTEPLTADDVAEISRIEAPRKGIRDLTGLQHCRSLMLVDFADNEITDLTPLAGLKKLQSVTLAGNHIADISPLSQLTAIQLLDLSRNELANLDALRDMVNMRTLYLADNRLDDIVAVSGLKKIGALDVAGNKIVDLAPLSDWKWLTTLEISDNPVRSLDPLTKLTHLSMLIMPNNPIDSLDPLVKMCVEDAGGDRRFAPYLKVYLDMQSDEAAARQGAIDKLKEVGVSVHDYRRPTPSKSINAS